jgi:hypothetical protein
MKTKDVQDNLITTITQFFMRNRIISSISFLLFLLWVMSAHTQTPTDGLFMEKNEICIAVMGSHDTWDHYWEGRLLRDNQNIGILTRNTLMPMAAYGISSKINLLVGLPYVSTSPSGGQMTGVSGWQDLSIFLKFKPYSSHNDRWTLLSFVTAGFSTPASGYLSDYQPFSLGLGTQEYSLRAIVKTEYLEKYYFRGSAAFLHRTTTEAERDYYYTTKGIYTSTMDVPDATNFELALGLWMFNRAIQLEGAYVAQTSLSGDDIRRQNQAQPTNKMDWTSVNGRLRYFTPFFEGFSLMANYGQVLTGRNVGQSTVISGGITYQFPLKK